MENIRVGARDGTIQGCCHVSSRGRIISLTIND